MALNQIFNHFSKIFNNFKEKTKNYEVLNWKYFIYLFSIILFFSIFIIISHLINEKNKIERQNLNLLVESKNFQT